MLKKLLLVGVGVFVFLSVHGCNLPTEDLVMPTWDSDFTVPITQQTYTIDSIIGKQKNIISDATADNLYVIESDTFSQSKVITDFIELSNQVDVSEQMSPSNGSTNVFIPFRTDEVQIDSAAFLKGDIQIKVKNNSITPVTFSVVTPGITKNGQKFSISVSVQPNEEKVLSRNLAEYIYKIPLEQLNNFPARYRNQFWVEAKTTSSFVDPIGKVDFQVFISNFSFSSVTGKFPETRIGKKTQSFSTELGEDVNDYNGKIKLKEAKLTLDAKYQAAVPNTIKITVDSLMLKATKAGNAPFYVLNKDAASPYYNTPYFKIQLQSGSNKIEFTHLNSNILEFIEYIPDSVEIEAVYKINAGTNSETVTNRDIVTFSSNFSTKSIVKLQKTWLNDEVEINIDEDNRKTIQDGKFASLNVELENAIPLTMWAKVKLLDEFRRPLFTINNSLGQDSIEFTAANVDVNTGLVTTPKISKQIIQLNEQQIMMLSKAYFAEVSVTVESSNNASTFVQVRASDWIKIKVMGSVKLKVDLNDDEEEN